MPNFAKCELFKMLTSSNETTCNYDVPCSGLGHERLGWQRLWRHKYHLLWLHTCSNAKPGEPQHNQVIVNHMILVQHGRSSIINYSIRVYCLSSPTRFKFDVIQLINRIINRIVCRCSTYHLHELTSVSTVVSHHYPLNLSTYPTSS